MLALHGQGLQYGSPVLRNGAIRSRGSSHLRYRALGLSVLLVGAFVGPACSQASADECRFPKIYVSRVGPPEISDPARRWTAGEVLAYDILLRSSEMNVWPESELRELSAKLEEALTRVQVGFGIRIEPQPEYLDRLIEVEFTREFWDQLLRLVPEPHSTRLVPESASPGLKKLAEDLCVCWIVPTARERVAGMYFQGTANLLYALRQIRDLPEAKAAGLARRVDDSQANLQQKENITAWRSNDAIYLTATMNRSGQVERRYFEANQTKVRELSPEAAASLPGILAHPLPLDIWRP